MWTVLPSGNRRDELVAGHARPGAHAAGVEVDEGRDGIRVVADAAALQPHADRADASDRHVRQIEVHRLAEHVLAVLGDARASGGAAWRWCRASGRPRRRGSARSSRPRDRPPRRYRTGAGPSRRLVAAPVAQEPVQLLQRLGIVAAVALERDGRALLACGCGEASGCGCRRWRPRPAFRARRPRWRPGRRRTARRDCAEREGCGRTARERGRYLTIRLPACAAPIRRRLMVNGELPRNGYAVRFKRDAIRRRHDCRGREPERRSWQNRGACGVADAVSAPQAERGAHRAVDAVEVVERRAARPSRRPRA